MSGAILPEAQRVHAERNLPRYTSYPTALSFDSAHAGEPQAWYGATRSDDTLSAYVHVPFCRRLCWYCGCHTSIAPTYDRVGKYLDVLRREIDLVAASLGEHDGLAHLHFGGGSPNALRPADFVDLTARLGHAFRLLPGAEIAAELDPGMLSPTFIEAVGEAGVTRVSLGVQTFDPAVQVMVNRVQPYDHVARAVEGLRAAGVGGLNFDLMYGLPGQTPDNVHASAREAVALRPDRIAVFGYAHVPWMKKHQTMIREADLADLDGRWLQAEAADAALVEAGYIRIGLDQAADVRHGRRCRGSLPRAGDVQRPAGRELRNYRRPGAGGHLPSRRRGDLDPRNGAAADARGRRCLRRPTAQGGQAARQGRVIM
jgi:oxygen-independent coproporphyrinogen-3 oxidase